MLSAARMTRSSMTSSVLRNVRGRTPNSRSSRSVWASTCARNSPSFVRNASEWWDVSETRSRHPVSASARKLSSASGAHSVIWSSAVLVIDMAQRKRSPCFSARRSKSAFIGR